MATYTNLTSLEGLQVGDVVNYTTTTAFDSKGYKFKIQLYGKKAGANGGRTVFTIDTNTLPEKILSFNIRGDLIYGNTTDVYYRIAVAGDAGGDGKGGTSAKTGGAGGGSTGAQGQGSSSSAGKGGGQTYGGTGGGTATNKNGDFGFGGYGSSGTVSSGGRGGYGWYGGGGGAYNNQGGGGGSGFIIGVSTTTYPAGYLGGDTALQSTIASSITEGTLTQGGSSNTTPTMTMTILELPPVEEDPQSTLKYFNGTDFIDTNAKYYNGSELVNCDVYYFDGTELKKI